MCNVTYMYSITYNVLEGLRSFWGEGLVKESTQKSGGFSYDRWAFRADGYFHGGEMVPIYLAAKISG